MLLHLDILGISRYTECIGSGKGGNAVQIVKEETNVQICCHVQDSFSTTHTFHWHENYEICQVVQGSCRFLVDGVLIEADAGDIVTISEHTVHRFLVEHDGIFVRILQFPLHVLLHSAFAVQPLRMHIPAGEIASVSGLGERLETLFSLMEQEGTLHHGCENAYLNALASSVYFLLMRHFADTSDNGGKSKERMEFFRIVEYCNSHYTEDINASSLAEKLYLTRGHLSGVFSRYAGMSVNDYLNTLRIKHANDLLHRGCSITQAALESGFQSIRTFNNVYKKVMGSTPSEYLHRDHSAN
ncbi:MAG: helix-turn-helix domain-containing protein [Ruminococcaceae bacterium]|nr:helix-turn-helix domain-containing protein [Oscillospiraceae bacterium]